MKESLILQNFFSYIHDVKLTTNKHKTHIHQQVNEKITTMTKNITIHLVQLIQSLSSSEKRSFKLFAKRSGNSTESAKFILLFNFIDRSSNYDDTLFLKRHPEIKKIQLPNIKSHLYHQILNSLRNLHSGHYKLMELRESLDHAYILYIKGLHSSALRIIERTKCKAEQANDRVLLLELIEFEKRIEALYITRGFKDRAAQLIEDSTRLSNQVSKTVAYSNLTLELYGLYTKVGVVRNERDFQVIQSMFEDKLPKFEAEELGFHERLMLYNAYVWYYVITQDFLMGYRYSQKWVDLFDEFPAMRTIEFEMYLKGYNNLLLALFNIRNHPRLTQAITDFEQLEMPDYRGDNVNVQYYLFLYTALINKHYLEGSFSEGTKLAETIDEFIDRHAHILDQHRIMVLYYKIGCLFFGAGMNKEAIRYLNRVIQFKVQAWREDIQSFARILNLIAHYELGNDILVEYQVKSVYRFLLKKNDLNGVQIEILGFLRKLPLSSRDQESLAFGNLLEKLVALSHKPYEKRPFLYLDIISWLESKLTGKTVQEIVQLKFKEEQRTGKLLYFPVKKS